MGAAGRWLVEEVLKKLAQSPSKRSILEWQRALNISLVQRVAGVHARLGATEAATLEELTLKFGGLDAYRRLCAADDAYSRAQQLEARAMWDGAVRLYRQAVAADPQQMQALSGL